MIQYANSDNLRLLQNPTYYSLSADFISSMYREVSFCRKDLIIGIGDDPLRRD